MKTRSRISVIGFGTDDGEENASEHNVRTHLNWKLAGILSTSVTTIIRHQADSKVKRSLSHGKHRWRRRRHQAFKLEKEL